MTYRALLLIQNNFTWFASKCIPIIMGRRNLNTFQRNYQKSGFGKYSVVMPGTISKERLVPQTIRYPPYVHGREICIEAPEVKNHEQILKMKQSCNLAKQLLDIVGYNIKIGQTTDDIDSLVHKLAVENGAYPSPLNYAGFPKSVCTSVNNVACHGIPDDRPLVDGDILTVDVTVYLDEYHGDCAATFTIGNVDEQGQKLVAAAKQCLNSAIDICKPGVPFSNIGETVQAVAQQLGVTVVPAFTGHGIGTYFHGPPDIYHCYNDYPGLMLPGMTFTIEPVLAQGSEEVVILEDGWTAVMLDNGRSSQFEHTVLITETGVEILTH